MAIRRLALKRYRWMGVFFSYLVLIVTMILTHRTCLGVQDEAMLQATLCNQEPINYMTSYPLAILFGSLYHYFPSIQWYSVLMSAYITLVALVLSGYVVLLELPDRILNILFKIVSYFTALILIVYMLLEVDVTTPTLLLVLLGIPLVARYQILFWILLWIATLLREQIVISVWPLLILAYGMQVRKDYFTSQRTVWIILLFLGVMFNHLSYKLDRTYDKWMDFTEARAYYTDFGGTQTHGLLTPDEYHLSKTWWITDLDIYPYDKIRKAAGNMIDIVESRYANLQCGLQYFFKKHPSLYWLIAFSLLVILLHRSWRKFFGYGAFTAGVLVLLFVKDVDRVTLPVLLMWWILIGTDLWERRSGRWSVPIQLLLIVILGWGGYVIVRDIPFDRITHYHRREALAKEFKDIIDRNHMELEITSGYPASWDKLIEAIMQNHLFDEHHWAGYHNRLLLSGWLTRVPLVYRQHHISFGGVKRRFDHYHDWMMQPNTGIIGSLGETRHVRPFLVANLMKFYDRKFPQKGCHHRPIVVDRTQHFIIHRIIEECDAIKPAGSHIPLQTSALLWRLEQVSSAQLYQLHLEGSGMVVEGGDPQILLPVLKVPETERVILSVKVFVPEETRMQIYYRLNDRIPYDEYDSYAVMLHKGDNTIHLHIPAVYVRHGLRIDPAEKKGIYHYREFALYALRVH